MAAAFFFIRRAAVKKLSAAGSEATKKQKRLAKLWLVIMIAALYVAVVKGLTVIFGKPESGEIDISIWAKRIDVHGYSLSMTVVNTWIVMAVLIIAALIIRLFVLPRFKDIPKGAQNVIELMVEYADKYTKSKTVDLGDGLGSYIFVIGAFLVGCAVIELFGVAAPTSDITLTFALSLLTFILFNIYGIKKKGVGGRLKSLATPTPIVFPMKLVSDCAIPISMACRLFGNMLGGMIVMDLLYTVLGNGAVGIPSVLGLYFNVFHPLIQAFIFITLTLTFTNEATE